MCPCSDGLTFEEYLLLLPDDARSARLRETLLGGAGPLLPTMASLLSP